MTLPLVKGLIGNIVAAFNGFIFSGIRGTTVFGTTDFGNAARVASGDPTKINLGLRDGVLDEKHVRHVGSVSDIVVTTDTVFFAGNKVN